MKLFITGGCGFLGSNLAAAALKRGDTVAILDNLSRLGASENLAWLKDKGAFTFVHADIRNANDVERAIAGFRPDAVFHVAGQVAMTTSIDDPRRDFEINVLGTFNLLDAVRRHAPQATVVYSSTNKVYGDLLQYRYEEQTTRWSCIERPLGFAEDSQLEFHSPYGCSKGAADQYMLDAHRMWGLKTIVFRHSSMYGGRQFATYDQGWVGWFCRQAVEQSVARAERREPVPFTISGDGKQVRDILHAEDMVSLYFSAVANAETASGQAFNIGGGLANSLSLLELFGHLEKCLGISLKFKHQQARSSDQLVFVADISKAVKSLQWTPKVGVAEGIKSMVAWTEKQIGSR